MVRNRNPAPRASRRTGTYYTPWSLAYDIAGQTLRASLNNHIGNPLDARLAFESENGNGRTKMLKHLEKISVLDPAVGEGVFLNAAAEWLERTRRALGDDRPVQVLRSEIVTSSLFGVDVRPDAVSTCVNALVKWTGTRDSKQLKSELQINNIKQGNSLIGWSDVPKGCNQSDLECFDNLLIERLNTAGGTNLEEQLDEISPLHWPIEFSQIMSRGAGFDVMLGNPPYGNILSVFERDIISKTHKSDVSTSRNGTWNIAALFIARSLELLRSEGQLGFLIPNSVLRTKQFFRVRRFLLEKMPLWKIVDEASPFEGVTLEMVSIFCTAAENFDRYSVKVESRRSGIEWQGEVPWRILDSSGVFPIYYDAIMSSILERTTKGWATAQRGRDLAKSHVSKKKREQFQIPYATSGRSVKRFRLDERYLLYADSSFREDSGLRQSHENHLLVATKNYPYPRCVMKPRGIIHGGGVVEINPLREDIQLEALGLILNSKLVKYICIKYLTNYSQLTTCLNTGIMEELPLMMPKDQTAFTQLFRSLQELHQKTDDHAQSDDISFLEETANALVYEMYLTDSNELQRATSSAVSQLSKPIESGELVRALSAEEVMQSVRRIMNHQMVKQVEATPRMRT
jgi:hypothetical protein